MRAGAIPAAARARRDETAGPAAQAHRYFISPRPAAAALVAIAAHVAMIAAYAP
jgi:hypothetical protein